MISDFERHEATRRLREFADDYWLGGDRVMDGAEAMDRLFEAIGFDFRDPENWLVLENGGKDLTPAYLRRLADLIEPSDSAQTVAEDMFGQMRHSTEQERIACADMMARNSVELHTVDRDALLALADEMDTIAASEETYMVPYWYLDNYADRIREALGVGQ